MLQSIFIGLIFYNPNIAFVQYLHAAESRKISEMNNTNNNFKFFYLLQLHSSSQHMIKFDYTLYAFKTSL